MKVALIPPISLLREFGQGKFHLLLSHLVDNDLYWNHYKEQRRRGAYLILDNSAHEYGEGTDGLDLLKKGKELYAQELVVPDVLFDHWGTLKRASNTLNLWTKNTRIRNQFLKLNPRLMFVPQGNSPEEWASCLESLCVLYKKSVRFHPSMKHGFVIGVSKDYESWDGGLPYLFKKYLIPMRQQYRFQVHLLGWGRKITELAYLQKTHPWIRSVDSAKPFVYGINEIEIHFNSIPEYPGRPQGYFFMDGFTEEMKRCMRFNVSIFKETAGA